METGTGKGRTVRGCREKNDGKMKTVGVNPAPIKADSITL